MSVRRELRRLVGTESERNLDRYGWIVGFLVVYAVLLRDVTLGRPYAFGDFPPYLGRDALATFASTWHFEMLGFPHHYTTIAGYVGAVTTVGGAIAGQLGLDPQTGQILAQNLLYLSLIPAGFATFAVFAGRFVDDPAARFVAAGVYAVNPVTIGEFVNGGANEFLAFVGAPLVLHYLWEVGETDDWLPALLAGAVFGATAVVPWTAFWLVAPFATYLVVRYRHDLTVLGKFVAAGILGILLALPSVFYIVERAAGLDATAMMFEHVSWNYQAATIPALLRLAGNHGSYAMTQLGYNSEPAMLVGLVIPAVGLFAATKRRLGFCFPIVAVLVGFMALTRLEVTYPLFQAVPLLWTVRNPAKLQFPLLLALSLLFAGGLDTILARVGTMADGTVLRGSGPTVSGRGLGNMRGPIVGERLLRMVVLGLVVLTLISYAAPAGGGALGLTETRGDEHYVASDYQTVADRIDGRALWIPYSYTTQLRLRTAYPNHVGVQSGAFETGKPNAEYVRRLFADVAAGESIRNRLATLGVQYVVVDHTEQRRYPAAEGQPRVAIRHGAPWLFGDPGTFADRLAATEGYTRAFSTERFTVYRVSGVSERQRIEEYQGLHRTYYPTATNPEPVSSSLLTNGDFDDGLAGWWRWTGTNRTQTTVTDTAEGRAALLVTESGETYPIAQQATVRDRYPYRLKVDAVGAGTVNLYWYNGTKAAANRTAIDRFALDSLPRTVQAKGDRVSIRIRPNGDRLVVREASLRRTTYPASTGLAHNTAGIPGAVVDGRTSDVESGAVVAVNLNASRRERVDPDVRVRDAETVVDGELVFDDRYRQGVAVRLPDGERPAAIPDNATLVTYETPRGPVLDYWVVGSFDRTQVTLLDTSYDERWTAGPGAEQFAAFGWANGFTNAEPADVRFTGGDTRRWLLRVWVGLWLVTLVGLAGLWLQRRRAKRTQSNHLLSHD